MNVQRFNELCRKSNVDAVVAATPFNVFYSTGFLSLGQKFIHGTKVFSVVVPGTPPKITLVVSVGESDMAIEEIRPGVDIWPYGGFFIDGTDPKAPGNDGKLSQVLASSKAADPIDALLSLLASLGLTGSRIAVDEGGFTPKEWTKVSEHHRGMLEPGNSLLQQVRMVKTPREIENLRYAAALTYRAIDYSLAHVKEGMTERELQCIYESFILQDGAGTAVSVVLFGEHSAYPNGVAGDRRLRNGDVIRFDCGCVYKNYYADLARVAVFGKPKGDLLSRVSTYHAAILNGMEKAIKAMKPGVKAKQLYEITVQTTRESGLPQFKRTHCGHGIGVEMYDPPVLRETTEIPVEAGMVFCVEAPYYELGLGGIQVEDTVVVTPTGAEYLSPATKPLQVLE